MTSARRRGWTLAGAALLAVAAWYWHATQPATIRAGIERELAQVAAERRAVHADALRRHAEDRAFSVEIGPTMDRETASLLAQTRTTASQLDRIELERLAAKEARLRARLSALPR